MSLTLPRLVYGAGWRAALPFLMRNARLAAGMAQRTLETPLPRADLWLQASSAGEAALAVELARNLPSRGTVTILVTTSTDQGYGLVEQAAAGLAAERPGLRLIPAYQPFDAPRLAARAVDQVRPKALVLLETELWPGLLLACREAGVPVVVVNGRMATKSLARYLLWPRLWREVAPERVLAVSEADSLRFSALFGAGRVAVMPNMKFDRVATSASENPAGAALSRLLPEDTPFLVLGSVREQEEAALSGVLSRVLAARPETVVGLYPRHMYRITGWRARLTSWQLPWVLRSKADGVLAPGTVLLGDVFGELAAAYVLARAAFVGGSLARLGGQNFLEAAAAGVVPVIGPHWKNFAWVGREILAEGLAVEVPGPDALAGALLARLAEPESRPAVRARLAVFVDSRRGGTRQACETLASFLDRA